ncbi:MAG: universal stress protein [Terriglobales bacterium]
MSFKPAIILALVDLSPATGDVLAWTRLFAEKTSAKVRILHVIWPPATRLGSQEEGAILLDEFEERRLDLRGSIKAHAQELLADIPFEMEVGVGHPVKVALETIAALRPGLIVLGSHGHDGITRSLLGSVAENVVRESAFPTLIVKATDIEPALKTILCPVDLGDVAAQSLDTAAEMARVFGARLDVLRVLPQGPNADEELKAMRQWVPEIVAQRCPTSESVHTGDTAEQIVVFARQHDSDLIVVGAEPRRFLEFTVLGRTTERVVRHGPCSVLVVRLEPRSN